MKGIDVKGVNIIAYLREESEGCDYSGHFRTTWINNEKLHPKAKAVPVQVEPAMEETEIILLRDHTQLIVQRENQVRPDILQQAILAELKE